MKKMSFRIVLVTMLISWLAACTPEVGSPEWCEKMKEKDKGDWTANEAKDYMKYCVLKQERK